MIRRIERDKKEWSYERRRGSYVKSEGCSKEGDTGEQRLTCCGW